MCYSLLFTASPFFFMYLRLVWHWTYPALPMISPAPPITHWHSTHWLWSGQRQATENSQPGCMWILNPARILSVAVILTSEVRGQAPNDRSPQWKAAWFASLCVDQCGSQGMEIHLACGELGPLSAPGHAGLVVNGRKLISGKLSDSRVILE